jgi:hypothetical protein
MKSQNSNYSSQILDESLEEAANLNDGLHMFAQILRSYKQQPSAYSLQFCARATPTLKALLSHKNSNYVDLVSFYLKYSLNLIKLGVNQYEFRLWIP